MLATSLLTLPALGQNKSTLKNRPNKYVLTKSGENRITEHFGGGTKNLLKLSGKDNDGDMAVFEIYAQENHPGTMLHTHHEQDEHVIIIEGEYIFQIGEERFRLKAGDNIFMPRGIPHGFVFIGKGSGRKISVFQPAGQIESFFIALGKETPPIKAERMQELMNLNNMEVSGPPVEGE